jgi:hypothetical protein
MSNLKKRSWPSGVFKCARWVEPRPPIHRYRRKAQKWFKESVRRP